MTVARISLIALVLFLALLGGEPSGSHERYFEDNAGPGATPTVIDVIPGDPVLRLIGKTFTEIKQTLGEV